MIRVDHWSRPRKEKYALVEYIHHSGLIRYDEQPLRGAAT